MIIDARELTTEQVLQTDVCIIGAGPAGLTLVREFLGQSFQVCLLESGGLEPPDRQTADLSRVESIGEFLPNTSTASHWYSLTDRGDTTQVNPIGRNRQLRHVPLAAADFEVRSHIPYSGWVFDRNHLEPYYQRAHDQLQMGAFDYEANHWASSESPVFPFVADGLSRDSANLVSRMFRFSPSANFYQTGRQLLETAPNITTYIHATVLALETDELGQTVQRVKVGCFGGKQFWVTAKLVILATGGTENAQLLLLSDQVQRTGLGNDQDLVGRFFMDHPLIYGGRLTPKNRQLFKAMALYDLRCINGANGMAHLAPSNEMLHQSGATNFGAYLFPRPRIFRSGPGMRALKAILMFGMLRQNPLRLLKYFAETILHVDDILLESSDWLYRTLMRQHPYRAYFSNGGWSEQELRLEKAYQVFEVVMQTEQLPHPDNRLVLSHKLDPLGRRKAALQTVWRSPDFQGIQRGQQLLASEFAKSGLATFHPEWHGDRPFFIYTSAAHQMGTTRMAVSPKWGVVDAQCRVHSVNNLYIAGSSVFPTAGYANPTLTIMALAIRLGDRIKALML
jgi:choline dehydrogenase-like flavoprotein